MNDAKVEAIAKVCHDANRSYCATVGDPSQPPWETAPDWQQDSARNGVRFHLESLAHGETASQSAAHESWLAEKVANGWVYGPVKDAEKKTHPCIVPYSELPDWQQKKDALFVAIVKALA